MRWSRRAPKTVFARPSDVFDEVMLTSGEKLAVLERWRHSILSQLGAADNGMATRGASPTILAEIDEIDAVKRWLRAH